MEIYLDFSDVARRRAKTNHSGECSHAPPCFIWQSSDGPVHVCQMGDWHLVYAYRKAARNAENPEIPEDVRDEWEEAALGLGDEIDRRDLWREVRSRWNDT